MRPYSISDVAHADDSVITSARELLSKGLIDNNYLRNLLDSHRISLLEYVAITEGRNEQTLA